VFGALCLELCVWSSVFGALCLELCVWSSVFGALCLPPTWPLCMHVSLKGLIVIHQYVNF
jgi:hypothetical protein